MSESKTTKPSLKEIMRLAKEKEEFSGSSKEFLKWLNKKR